MNTKLSNVRNNRIMSCFKFIYMFNSQNVLKVAINHNQIKNYFEKNRFKCKNTYNEHRTLTFKNKLRVLYAVIFSLELKSVIILCLKKRAITVKIEYLKSIRLYFFNLKLHFLLALLQNILYFLL